MALDLSDIGLTPSVAGTADASRAAATTKVGTIPLVPGSLLAQALYSVWSGTECLVVKSPPGGGKSTLIAQLAHMLHEGLGEVITILTPTNAAGIALGQRINEAFGPGTAVGMSSNIASVLNEEASQVDGHGIRISTVASALMSMEPHRPAGIVIVDEAYQVSYADACEALSAAAQVVLVGDPGQIGPVVTIDTSIFSGREHGPHTPAPAVFETIPGAEILSIDATYRLGTDTADVIGCLYDFPFTSRRAPKEIEGLSEIETLALDTASSVHDTAMLDAVVDRVIDLIGARHLRTDPESGQVEADDIRGWHIAVVVAHTVQSSYIEARLASLATQENMLDMVSVGTADRIQGGQWPAVVALDPMVGVETLTDHHTSLGRLCVMLSRHTSHLTFVHEDTWRSRLAGADSAVASTMAKHRRIRRMLGI